MIIDGITPTSVLQPGSIPELAEMLCAEPGAIVPIGGATQLHFGNPLRRADAAIDLKRLSKITEYNPADLTIHVECGVTLGHLEQTLLEHNQFLPLDPWNGPGATIGGIAAANAQGPFRATGTIRDWIIGVKVVHADGRIAKAGGRVVKNVTGYDLARLYTGSLGTLGIIAEISLKLRARFSRTATAVARFEPAGVAAAVAAIRKSPLQPIACEWVGPDQSVWVRFGEHPQAVEWQIRNLPAGDWEILEGEREVAAWRDLRQQYHALGPIVLRVIGLPTVIGEIIDTHRPQSWIAHVLNGVALVALSTAGEVRDIRQNRRAIVEKAPLAVRSEIPTFGLNDAEYDLMKRLKDEFDPEARLNPGRHVDGER